MKYISNMNVSYLMQDYIIDNTQLIKNGPQLKACGYMHPKNNDTDNNFLFTNAFLMLSITGVNEHTLFKTKKKVLLLS